MNPIRRVVVASGNPGKLREIRDLLAELPLEILPQFEFDVAEAEETGLTFVENALIKARHASAITGLSAVADDSGLVVDALRGAPGIHSARYAGAGASDRDNVDKLLSALRDVPPDDRGARFECVVVYLRHAEDPVPIICTGTWEGAILAEPRGRQGFGYDPVFSVPGHACSSAELPAEVKNNLSHRGQALRKLVEAFAANLHPNRA